MDRIRIVGGARLSGTVQVSGAKNAALPVLISSLLNDQECKFERVPNLQDIKTTLALLEHMGAKVQADPAHNRVSIDAGSVNTQEAPYDLVRKMRASVVVLGPLLARFGYAKVSLPGGCAIGARPIDLHLKGLERLGAEIELDQGYVIAKAKNKRLVGNRVRFEFPSVGATENVMMAAALARGESVLENCAREPEIVDLADALNAMGAEISGAGTETITIQGKDSLHSAQHTIMADRIEAGTYLAASLATRGDVTVLGLDPNHLEAVLVKFEAAGAQVERGDQKIRLKMDQRSIAQDIKTLPFPGFPTDMQAQWLVAMIGAQGTSVVTETIFENRFMHVPELCRLGADITIRGNTAVVKGVDVLRGAPLMATDLRASASLVIGGLIAQGETCVSRIYHLDRGYEGMESKLKALGAQIERVPG
jgi:UDP-N-acetylglucosamine 1-carboxyvinyltransferase